MLKELNYIVNGQTLTGESFKMASDTVNEIKVSFAFEGTDWSGLDSIKAVFSNNRVASSYEAVLVNGTCTIPHEVLAEKGTVSVNLYGSIITGTTLTTRITSYKSACVDVLQKVNVSGSNSVVPTPATWEQQLAAHTQNTTVHVTAQNKTDWNAKSTVSVSDEGTATDEVQYITVNGVEKKLPSGGIEEVEWGDIGGTLADQEDLAEALDGKAPTSHNHNDLYYGKSDTYTKAEVNSAISNHHDSSKADVSTTYSKSEVDSAISGHHDSTKADVGVSYTKAEEDALLDDKADAEDIPTKTSELTNDSGFIDSSYHDNTKVDKVEGKGLSKNDFTDTLKDKLDGIEANADVTDADNVKSSGATMGVKVAGTELAKDSDGKVNVPVASSSQVGVGLAKAVNGIYVSGNEFVLYRADNNTINAKTNYTQPITPAYLDYAIKAGLTSNSQIQSDADKKACCGTIGAVYDGEYELIEEITLTEAVRTITRNVTTIGESYNFRNVLVNLSCPVDSTYSTNNYFYIKCNGNSALCVYDSYLPSRGLRVWSVFNINGGRAFVSAVKGNGTSDMYGRDRMDMSTATLGYFEASALTSVTVTCDSGFEFPIGTVIRIYAIRN